MVQTLNIYNLLQECKVESDVEEKYKRILQSFFPKSTINSPYNTDGVLEDLDSNLKLLLELKHDIDLIKRSSLIELLIQILYYLKKFEMYGEELPNVVFGGDINECFCSHTNNLLPYLSMDIDWSLAPSEAPFRNPELSKALYDDNNINPYIFSINNSKFDFKFVVNNITELLTGEVQKIRITELNIDRFFRYFKDRIIKSKKKYNANQLVSIFLNCIINPNENYLHPKKNNILVTDSVGEVIINRPVYEAFFKHFESNYSIPEKSRLTAICDRLIEDETRRFRGEFYTPTEWALEVHKMIEKVLGADCREKYAWWNSAWGTGNLTRDFKFKELYCSTINYSDLAIAQQYNPEAVKFQYDFLNDDVVSEGTLPIDGIKKLPDSLDKSLKENKPIILFMNPPFGVAGDYFLQRKTKNNITKNKVKDHMKNLSLAQQNLYTNFLFRVIQLKRHYSNENIVLCTFSPLSFLTKPMYKKFRQVFFSEFTYQDGFIMSSKNFSDTVGDWPVLFSIWTSGQMSNKQIAVKILEKYPLEIHCIGNKFIYNTDNIEDAKTWAKIKTKNKQAPALSNPIRLKNEMYSILCDKMIAYFLNDSNDISSSIKGCGIFSYGLGRGFPFLSKNFENVIALYTARKLSIPIWYNANDQFLKPNVSHKDYPKWNIDCIIYSMFSGQSSLRNVESCGKIWNIKNEFFWMSNSQMLQLANKNRFDELYYDANGDHNRFVYNRLQKVILSNDAQAILNKATELVIKTFPYRKQLHEENPEWHLNTWDAGWYQIKLILNKYFKDDLKEFNQLFRSFGNRMREGVYKFGFLK